MKGIELSEIFYKEHAAPMLEAKYPGYIGRIAVGVAGQGSDCFGFDDEISQDHDFGPGCCMWLTDKDFAAIGAKLSRDYNELPKTVRCFKANTTEQGTGRRGVTQINTFYRQFTGCIGVPDNNFMWLKIPEHYLAAATNGKIFRDDLGIFSEIRQRLLDFYPRDVKLKKLAARVFTMAQAGQYNYARSVKRNDAVAASFALAEFTKAALSALHIINDRYTPYYKWSFRSAEQLPLLSSVPQKIKDLYDSSADRIAIIEEICDDIKDELRREALSSSGDSFLVAQAEEIMKRIEDEQVKKLPVMVG